MQERGRSASEINTDLLLSSSPKQSSRGLSEIHRVEWKAPPRLLSDQMVNIFFQEWAPLFPVLHRPTFLTLYEEFTSAPETIKDRTSLAQLNLVFGLAALSHGVSQSIILSALS